MVIRENYYCAGGSSIDQYYWSQTNSSQACAMYCNSNLNLPKWWIFHIKSFFK